MKSVSKLGCLSLVISVVGALNWGLVGLLNFNLVTHLFHGHADLIKGTYLLIGLAGLYAAYCLFIGCSACKKSC